MHHLIILTVLTIITSSIATYNELSLFVSRQTDRKCRFANNQLICSQVSNMDDTLSEINVIGNNVNSLILTQCNVPKIKSQLFSGFTALKHIQITESNVTEIERNAFRELGTLLTLNLSNNKLGRNEIETEWFRNLHQLQELDLSNNYIQKIESEVFDKLKALKIYRFQENLVKEINRKNLPQSSQLEILDLGHNGIEIVESKPFSRYPGLTYLNLQGNYIKVLENYTFDNLGKLEFLNLSGSGIEIIHDFAFYKGMVSLSTLDLSHNNLNYIGSATFYGLNSLKSLNLLGNDMIQVMDYPFLSLSSLTTLFLPVYCYQEFIKWGMFTGLRSITDLDLSYHELSASGEFYFQGLDGILSLNLSHNRYEQIYPNMFFPMSKVVTLDLSFNQITKIFPAAFYGLDSLKYLLINNNQLTNFEFVYPKLRLGTLNLNNNRLDSLQIGEKDNPVYVQKIYIRFNSLKKLDDFYVRNMAILDIRNNFMRDFNFDDLLANNDQIEAIYVLFNKWNNCTKLTFFMKELINRKIVYQNHNTDTQAPLTGNNAVGIPCEVY